MCLHSVSKRRRVFPRRERQMRIKEIKSQIEFYTDTLFQSGYDLGWHSVLEELEQMADREWNLNNHVTADVIKHVVKQLRGDDEDDK